MDQAESGNGSAGPHEHRFGATAAENRCAQCGALLEPGDIFCGECGFIGRMLDRHSSPASQSTAAVSRVEGDSAPMSARVTADLRPSPPGPAFAAIGSTFAGTQQQLLASAPVDEDTEEYLLQFSTGESALVVGTGLIGRNPRSEPGEVLNHRVIINDPDRTVSKTHLEFGQEHGALWIRDRFSGNGTSIVGLDNTQRRLDAGKRYLVARGVRVYIGEQYFFVR